MPLTPSQFNLVQSLKRGTCCICHCVNSDLRRYFDTLIYENINDSGTRATILRSRGFCREHTRDLQRMGDALGQSILYSDLIGQLIGHLSQRESNSSDKCPACTKTDELTKWYITGLVDGLRNESFMDAYTHSGALLCLPHFSSVIKSCTSYRTAKTIVDLQRESMCELKNELDEFIRKSDYRFSGEPFGRERDAWIRAAHFLVGRWMS